MNWLQLGLLAKINRGLQRNLRFKKTKAENLFTVSSKTNIIKITPNALTNLQPSPTKLKIIIYCYLCPKMTWKILFNSIRKEGKMNNLESKPVQIWAMASTYSSHFHVPLTRKTRLEETREYLLWTAKKPT